MSKTKILVTGGSGYIGSHTIVDLIDNGFEVVCIDNFLRSTPQALEGVKAITGKEIKNYAVDLCDRAAVQKVFAEEKDIKGIIHFAALKTVPESVANPLLYFKNNIESLLNLLEAVQQYQIPYFVFSSSCSVYGNPDTLPVTEETPMKEAESPYARTKQIGEQMIKDFAKANQNLQFIALRYFNPVGAHTSALIGEFSTEKPENLVPIITQTAIGKRGKMFVHGHDYPTRDGSCIRDYIHVVDIANAHTKAVQYLAGNKNTANYEIFNLGTGEGVSVIEAIKAFEAVSGKTLNYELGDRRAGDVIAVYADNTKAKTLLGWNPKFNIQDMMKTAWAWELKLAEHK
jgi:UDP-glucose 4-epimerase